MGEARFDFDVGWCYVGLYGDCLVYGWHSFSDWRQVMAIRKVTCVTKFEIDTTEDLWQMILDYGYSADIDYVDVVNKDVKWEVE